MDSKSNGSQLGSCEVRYHTDGTIDEVVVFDRDGKCLVHLEDMGTWFFLGVGGESAFCLSPTGDFEGVRAIRCMWSWCNAPIKGHKPKGI